MQQNPSNTTIPNVLAQKQLLELIRREIGNSKTKDPRKEITLNQQVLLCMITGILDAIRTLNCSQKEKYQTLAFILNTDMDNTRKALENVSNPRDEKVKTSANYDFLISNLERLKMNTIADIVSAQRTSYFSRMKK